MLLPEIAWNLAVWRRLAQLEASLGYCFREKGLLREAPILTMATRMLAMAIGRTNIGSTNCGYTIGVHARRLLTYYGYIYSRRSRTPPTYLLWLYIL